MNSAAHSPPRPLNTVSGSPSAQPAPDDAQEERCGDQENDQQDKEGDRMREGEPQPERDHGVLGERRGPVAERLRRGVDRRARARLGEMHAGGERAAEDRRGEGHRRIGVAEHRRGERRARGNADEAVHGIPEAVEPGQLVGEELHRAHEAARGEDQRVLEQAQVLRQLEPAQRAGEAEGEDHRVGAQAAAPRERRSDREVRQVPLQELHYIVAPMVHGANSSSP
jgi:hypothetical protein